MVTVSLQYIETSCPCAVPVPECEVTPVLSGLEEQGPAHTSSQETVQQVFIKSFTFNPDLPIRIDYEAKGFKTEMVNPLAY